MPASAESRRRRHLSDSDSPQPRRLRSGDEDRHVSRSERHDRDRKRSRSRSREQDSPRKRRSRSPRISRRREKDRSISPSPPRRQRRYSQSQSPPRRFEKSRGPLPSQNDAYRSAPSGDGPSKDLEKVVEKQKPNFAPSGRLAAASNTVQTANQTIVLKYHEPPEARKPAASRPWRMYIFKDSEILDTLPLHEQSCWLFGREAAVADCHIEHPSASKQHAALQFRFTESVGEFGEKTGRVKPYVIDLESANGTRVNGERVPEGRYVELRSGDALSFGKSRREDLPLSHAAESAQHPTLEQDASAAPTYPNAGYLGSSSHTTIYDHIAFLDQEQSSVTGSPATPAVSDGAPKVPLSVISRGFTLLQDLRDNQQSKDLVSLVNVWLASGTNLALASAFIHDSTKAANAMLQAICGDHHDLAGISKRLSQGSIRPPLTKPRSTMEEYIEQFTTSGIRWETLGFFFTAVSRAASDIEYHPLLYGTAARRRAFQRQTLHYSDICLDIAVSLDCLNDLQLILQYENFIAHSMANGDQSYQSWRRLGDVISSIFALGYHEILGADDTSPQFLLELRRSAFGRAYSADKNVSLFLGRPTRLHRNSCSFKLLFDDLTVNSSFDVTKLCLHCTWPPDIAPDFVVGTKWFTLCALLKEELMEMSREVNDKIRTARCRAIEEAANQLWQALPAEFRLEEPLILCNRSPLRRDLRLSIKLDYQHVLFLVYSNLSPKASYSNHELVALASDIIVHTSRAMLMDRHLANSGISLVWKIIYYGVPAAGILCLALLHHPHHFGGESCSLTTVMQNLSVFVSAIEIGALVQFEFANFELLSKAAQTVKSVLRRVLLQHDPGSTNVEKQRFHGLEIPDTNSNEWMPWSEQGNWDFEIDFWSHLAEHPFLADPEPVTGVN